MYCYYLKYIVIPHSTGLVVANNLQLFCI